MIFAVVLSAAYPHQYLLPIKTALIYTVATLTVSSALHYSFSLARKLSSADSGDGAG
jgi:hypothetical protein